MESRNPIADPAVLDREPRERKEDLSSPAKIVPVDAVDKLDARRLRRASVNCLAMIPASFLRRNFKVALSK